jgi:hypothetical protein
MTIRRRGRPAGIVAGLNGTRVDPTKPYAVYTSLRETPAAQSCSTCYRWHALGWWLRLPFTVASWQPCPYASVNSWGVDPSWAGWTLGTPYIEQASLMVEATSFHALITMLGYANRGARAGSFDPDVTCPAPTPPAPSRRRPT